MHSVYQEIECNFQKNDKDFMQKELQKLRDIDDEIFETVEDSTKYIAWLLKESPIPKTAEILWMFIGSSNFIKNSIFDCSETEDIYSVKILFRSIIEHYLRFQFIFTKYGITKSDVESEKYYSILEISEYLNYVKSVRSVASIRGIDSKTLNEMWEELRTQFPYLDKYSKKEIEELSRQFSIKNMILFLEETTKVGKKEDSFLPKMILEYSNLSSYVHGGISAYQSTFNYSNEEVRIKELLRISTLSLQIASSIKLFSYLIFYQFKKEFGDLCNTTNELIKKIS